MEDNQKKIDDLLKQLESIKKTQWTISQEISDIQKSILNIQEKDPEKSAVVEQEINTKEVNPTIDYLPDPVIETPTEEIQPTKTTTITNQKTNNIEKFIGENLINKIGIVILILGVVFGTKYSIEHNLITPLTRIILGYVTGTILLMVGMKLKDKFLNYSAVLVSGAISILYFVTFVGYDFYQLMPQNVAFALMTIFTIFTVIAALKFDKQIIGILGLVGAYAVPFLLSNNTGRYDILFTYIALVNTGIMVISIQRYWRGMYHAAFALTWIIFTSWYFFQSDDAHSVLAFNFLTLYFIIFYTTFIGYKLLKKKEFKVSNIFLVLLNAFIFYGLGYHILEGTSSGENYLGLFTVLNALLHFIVAVVVYKNKLADRNLFYLIAGLVLLFITIAVPVQLEGNWVTMLWIGEAAIMFWIGTKRKVDMYLNFSVPLMLVALVSLFHDWSNMYNVLNVGGEAKNIATVFNIHFLTSLLFAIVSGFMLKLQYDAGLESTELNRTAQRSNASILLVPVLFGLSLFGAGFMEIATYWNDLYQTNVIRVPHPELNDFNEEFRNFDYRQFQTIWLCNYAVLFGLIFSLVNMYWLRLKRLAQVNLIFNIMAITCFLSLGLFAISELRETYLIKGEAELFKHRFYNLTIRYISLAFVVTTLIMSYLYVKMNFVKLRSQEITDAFFNTAIVWILSSELLHWMDIAGSAQMYKLGLSILWGTYALFMIVVGIWKDKKHLRYLAIILFAVTLVKLFLYDIKDLNTISKTIVFVSLGVLLLIISFLYNKYKHLIGNQDAE